MKYRKRSAEEISVRCRLLESLGFKIVHEDSDVGATIRGEFISFDFSNVSEEFFTEYALRKVSDIFFLKGRQSLRSDLHLLLNCGED